VSQPVHLGQQLFTNKSLQMYIVQVARVTVTPGAKPFFGEGVMAPLYLNVYAAAASASEPEIQRYLM
jgi:hypothetical protein